MQQQPGKVELSPVKRFTEFSLISAGRFITETEHKFKFESHLKKRKTYVQIPTEVNLC